MNKVSVEDLKIPLVIGITGHRDIPQKNIFDIKDKIKVIFNYIISKYPNTPIVFLSPLADGADRIAAEVALDEFSHKVTVSVPLPFDEETYKNTFGTNEKHKLRLDKEGSIAEFNLIMSKVEKQENTYVPKVIFMPYDGKKKNYSFVGEYIALHSHILIAVQNENSAKKAGGTREIVEKKLSGKYEYMGMDKEDVTYNERGVVYSIATPRIEDKVDNPDNPYEIKKHIPIMDVKVPDVEDIDETKIHLQEEEISIGLGELPSGNTLFDKINCYIFGNNCNVETGLNTFTLQHQKINCFNSDVEKNSKFIEKAFYKDILKLAGVDSETLKTYNFEKLRDESRKFLSNKQNKIDLLLQKNMMMRRSSAYLANRVYQPLVEVKEKGILLITTMIIFFLALKSSVGNFHFDVYVDSFYLFLLLPLLVLIYELKSIKEKQEDYRSLAEGLRVQIAWNIAQINESVSLYYLSHQRNELDWIRSAIRCTNIFYLPVLEPQSIKYELLYKYWIDEQKDYFVKNIPKIREKEIQTDKITKIAFGTFLGGSIVNFAFEFCPQCAKILVPIVGDFTFLDFGQFIFIILPLTVSAYFKSKQLFDGNDEKLREYQLSFDIFSKAKNMLDENEKENKKYNAVKIVKNLGIEALRENSSWIITRRTKEYSAPVN